MNSTALYWVPSVIVAIVSVAVVYLTRRSETKKHLESLRTTAYVDFIRGVAGLAVLQRHPSEGEHDYLRGVELTALVADAKARIALYGSESVVSSLAKFLRAGVVLDSPERATEFTVVCQRMRNDTRPRPGKVTEHDAHFLLFGFDLERYLTGTGGRTTESRSKDDVSK